MNETVKLNFKTIKYLSSRIVKSAKKQRFFNFSRFVALISVTLGSIALLVSLAVLTGFEKALHENAVKFTSHIKLIPINRIPFSDYPETINRILDYFPLVQSVTPVIEREGLIRSKKYIEGIMIKSFDPKSDVSNIKHNIVDGTYQFSGINSKELIIGKNLLRKLMLDVGDSVLLFAMRQTETGNYSYPDISKFKIIATFESGMSKYDDLVVFVPFETAASIFRLQSNSTIAYEIMLRDVEAIRQQAEAIQNYLGYPHFSLTVYDIHGAMFSWIDIQKEPIPIVLGLISIVAVFNILTILLITVVEKTNTIGVLRTLGLKNKEIMSIFIYQGVSLGFIGALIGTFIAYSFCWLQIEFKLIKLNGDIYFLDSLPIDINIVHYVIVIGTAVGLSFLSTIIPSLIATRINTISALRFR